MFAYRDGRGAEVGSPGTSMHKGQHRLRYLDGLRGVAISLVLVWHLFGPTYAQWLPYGSRDSYLPIASNGWVGVEIFFLISGFVIFMTMERCSGFVDFMLRRWLRLFPAMLVATALLFSIFRTFHLAGKYSNPGVLDIFPGLLFVTPSAVHAIFKVEIRSVDGVFWTLYVEVAFYTIFSSLYFWLGWRRAIAGLVVLAVAVRYAGTVLAALHAPHLAQRAVEPFEWLGIELFGWFASGALFYKARVMENRRLRALAIAIGLLAAGIFRLTVGATTETHILLGCVVLLFAAIETFPSLQKPLMFKPILFVGFISYPLYLVHNNLGVGLTAYFAARMPALPAEIGALPAVAIVTVIAWAIAKFAEPPLTAILRPWVNRLRQRLSATRS